MPSRLCPACRQVIPANQFQAHRQAHANQGKARHWTPEASRNRSRALKRDRHTCQKCGRTKAQLQMVGLELHVHHVNGRQDNRVEALLSLCSECHPRGRKADGSYKG